MQDTTRGGGLSLDSEFAILRVEDAVVRLPGVEAVRLVPGEHRPVDELHLITSPGTRPERVKVEVQAMLLDRFGLAVDWPAIQVAPRTQEQAVGVTPEQAEARLVLDAVHLDMRRHGTSVTVELEDGDARVSGEAGPVPTSGVLDAVATATAAAVTHAVGRPLDALDARVVAAGGDDVALVTVGLADARTPQRLSGCAVVHANEVDAVARAVLDATNRLERTAPSAAARQAPRAP
jgi:hypothetical protein